MSRSNYNKKCQALVMVLTEEERKQDSAPDYPLDGDSAYDVEHAKVCGTLLREDGGCWE